MSGVPYANLSGDTFDYTLDRDALHASVTDPMGHDIDSTLAATVLVNALRAPAGQGADGMVERHGEEVDLAALLVHTRDLHPGEAAPALASAARDSAGGRLEDDTTVMCLDRHGPHETQRHVSSGADSRQASAARGKQP